MPIARADPTNAYSSDGVVVVTCSECVRLTGCGAARASLRGSRVWALAPGFLCTFTRCAAFALTRASVFASLWSQRLRWWRPGLSPGWYASVRPAAYFFLSKTRKTERGWKLPTDHLAWPRVLPVPQNFLHFRPSGPPSPYSTAEPATLPGPAPPFQRIQKFGLRVCPGERPPTAHSNPKLVPASCPPGS